MKRLTTVFIVLAAVLACLTGARSGQGGHERAREAVEQGEILPLEDILEAARNAFEGEMLEVELEEERHGQFEDRLVYELKMLAADGAVTELYYDARTGELLKARGHGLEDRERDRAEDHPEHDDDHDDGWGWFWD